MRKVEGLRTKETIHFAHANGFPAKTYNKIFAVLQNDFDIGFIERHGHNSKFPVSDGWVYLKDELAEEIKHRYDQPIIGVGHSLGGILHLLVAAENPQLYKQIILLDAPIISRLSSRGLQLMKFTKLFDRFSPAHVTRFRRNLWKTKDEAFQHFQQKPKFAAFDEDVLRDYVEHGTVTSVKGFQLSFDQHVETEIYQTIPHTLPNLRGKIATPLAYVGGLHSREAQLARLSFMKKHFLIDFREIDGSHLFPFEKPIETAGLIRKIIG